MQVHRVSHAETLMLGLRLHCYCPEIVNNFETRHIYFALDSANYVTGPI